MKKHLKKIVVLAVLMLLLLLNTLGCYPMPTLPPSTNEDTRMLKVVGDTVRNKGGEGDVVHLRGANAGGLFLLETWMTGFMDNTRDHKTAARAFIERFGEEKAKALWAEYEANWWTDEDFKNCADMGMTAIRLPFSYMNVDFAAVTDYDNAGKAYDFTALDNFVEKAASYGMYTILDLHGAYGSQSGNDHSGEFIANPADVDFYSNERMQTLTINLWKQLATHFKDNPNVAAYDILNEPGEKRDAPPASNTEKRHWDFMDKVYDAIREVDVNHIVIFEACWEGENLPYPSEYGWENCIYSFHHYSNQELNTEEAYILHAKNINQKVSGITRRNFGIPIHIGEFSCYRNEASWEYTLNLYNSHGWHWNSWTYKVNNTWGNSGWGIYYVTHARGENEDAFKVDVFNDSEEQIIEKFRKIKTEQNAVEYTFSSGRTLFEVLKKYCEQKADIIDTTPIENGEYSFLAKEHNNAAVSVGEKIGLYSALTLKSGKQEGIKVTVHSDRDGSVLLSTSKGNLAVYAYNNETYVGVTGSASTYARFFPVKVGADEYVFMSYENCRYLRYDSMANAIKVDSLSPEEALKISIL